jgi:hypothetical protein
VQVSCKTCRRSPPAHTASSDYSHNCLQVSSASEAQLLDDLVATTWQGCLGSLLAARQGLGGEDDPTQPTEGESLAGVLMLFLLALPSLQVQC